MKVQLKKPMQSQQKKNKECEISLDVSSSCA